MTYRHWFGFVLAICVLILIYPKCKNHKGIHKNIHWHGSVATSELPTMLFQIDWPTTKFRALNGTTIFVNFFNYSLWFLLPPGGWFNITMSSSGTGISMLKIRRSRDRLILNMGIPYLAKTVFILNQGPGFHLSALLLPMALNALPRIWHTIWYNLVIWGCSFENLNAHFPKKASSSQWPRYIHLYQLPAIWWSSHWAIRWQYESAE